MVAWYECPAHNAWVHTSPQVDIIYPRILDRCIAQLLKICPNGDDYIESCCQVFTTVGPVLDARAAAGKDGAVDGWFRSLESTKRLPGVSTRVRFLVENLVDVRLNGWAGHSDGDNLKTITDGAATGGSASADTVPGTPSGAIPPMGDPNNSVHFITPQPSPLQGAASTSGGGHPAVSPATHPPSMEHPDPPPGGLATVREQASPPVEVLNDRSKDRIRNTVDEYLNVRDLTEVFVCLDEFRTQLGPSALLHFWESLVSKIMDCAKDAEREALLEVVAVRVGGAHIIMCIRVPNVMWVRDFP